MAIVTNAVQQCRHTPVLGKMLEGNEPFNVPLSSEAVHRST